MLMISNRVRGFLRAGSQIVSLKAWLIIFRGPSLRMTLVTFDVVRSSPKDWWSCAAIGCESSASMECPVFGEDSFMTLMPSFSCAMALNEASSPRGRVLMPD